MTDFNPAPYMRWAKSQPSARYDLAGSNLLACLPKDVPGILDDLPLFGSNPDGLPVLIEAVARRIGTEPDHVALATGCSGANFLVCAALLRCGDDVLVEHPVYDPLPAAARLVGARILRFERRFEDGWIVDPERLIRAITPRTRLVVLSSPHNPSGVLTPEDVIQTVGELAERNDAWVLVDEVYRDTTYDVRPQSAAFAHPRCIATSSLNKSYGLGGLRCGWAIGAPDVVTRIRRVRDAVEAAGVYPAEVASARAFAVLDQLEARARAIIEPNLERLSAFMDSRTDLSWVRPDGGTVAFPRMLGESDAGPFVESLRNDHDTAVVPGHFFDHPSHFRIAFGMSADTLNGGLQAITHVLQK